MSLFLYQLGGFISRHRGAVIGTWIVLLVVLVGASAAVGKNYDDKFSIPGTESQQGQQILEDRFETAAGASAQLLFTTDSGKITDDANTASVEQIRSAVAEVDGVAAVSDPLDADSLTVDSDGEAALASVQFDDARPSQHVLDATMEAAGGVESVDTVLGGSVYKSATGLGGSSEIIGMLIALLVLIMSFGSLVAAGMPLITALIGVGVTASTLALLSNVASITSTSPTFAQMLGLAVGIDYALFILSRHRAQLAEGLSPKESMARALGTSGSAVVFAGATVIIALIGLSVANIPFLSVMGLSAALSVAVAVVVALTLLPAIALVLGNRLRPKVRTRKRTKAVRPPLARRWVGLVTRRPVITIAAVVIALGVMTVPALSIQLALPDATTAAASSPERQSFEAVSDTFGPGYNAPLLITADVISNDAPTDAVDALADEIRALPGVVDITAATPNESGDTALIRVIPAGGQNDPETADLVHRIRDDASALESSTGVSDIRVTGTTATNIDVSERLSGALLPFGLTVVGLSIVLLMIVFRSVAVPLKATIGYALSVGASFGAIVAVFQWGWFASVLGVENPAPIVSFLPILVMGVLFGLAMDYEMFLVSRMREEYAHTGDPKRAVFGGFEHSAPVVAAAGLIMVAVFAAFVPEGTATIKPIAFGLAVGVFVDAFIVRMTLVPAVLILLGHRAWWMPRWLDRALPVVDVEGEVLGRHVQNVAWEADNGAAIVRATELVVRTGDTPLNLLIRPGSTTVLPTGNLVQARALAYVLTGHLAADSGSLTVGGLVLPEQQENLRRYSALVTDSIAPVGMTIEEYATERIAVGSWSRRTRRGLACGALHGFDSGLQAQSLTAGRLAELDAAIAVAMGVRLVVVLGAVSSAIAHRITATGATLIIVAAGALPAPTELMEAVSR
jgi:RND superfamily putative drug exporter